jgi:hypothetical protein
VTAPSLPPSSGCSRSPPAHYYLVEDYENMELILPPLSSIEMKIYIGIGCIIFIKIGYIITIRTSIYAKENLFIPALPLPVAFSAYIILLNVVREDLNSNLC